MIWFIVRRFLGLIFTLWIVFTLSFLLMHAVPGGPYSSERNLPPEIEENFKERYRLNLPIYEQYWHRLREQSHRRFRPEPAAARLQRQRGDCARLPISACLGILALTFAVTLGLSAGIVSALYRGSVADMALMSLATVGIAVPSFVIGGLSIMLFVFMIPIFPAAGWGTLRQLVLPAICLGSVYAAEIARITRTGMLDALSQDTCARPARKGLSEVAVALRHALPTALLPVVSFLGPAVAGILTGSVVVERIFAIPGLGWHFVQAATAARLHGLDGPGAAVHTAALHDEFPGRLVVRHSRSARGIEIRMSHRHHATTSASDPTVEPRGQGRLARAGRLATAASQSHGDALARHARHDRAARVLHAAAAARAARQASHRPAVRAAETHAAVRQNVRARLEGDRRNAGQAGCRV